MWIVELKANPNGSHNDHRADHITTVPEGCAMIPEDFAVPPSFPFVDIEAGEVTHHRTVEVEKEVTKTRQVPQYDEDGTMLAVMVTEEYTEMETVTEQHPYTVMTVISMTEKEVPEAPVVEPVPTIDERVSDLETALAESDAVAMALYEASVEQETVNAEQDEAILGLYEMIGG